MHINYICLGIMVFLHPYFNTNFFKFMYTLYVTVFIILKLFLEVSNNFPYKKVSLEITFQYFEKQSFPIFGSIVSWLTHYNTELFSREISEEIVRMTSNLKTTVQFLLILLVATLRHP